MSKLIYCCLAFLTASCRAGVSDYSETITEGYVWANEGEGFNAILSPVSEVGSLFYLRKYSSNGDYICAWQADSARVMDPVFRKADLKKNVYAPSDRFYILDVRHKKQYGPYLKEEFFKKADSLSIQVSWMP